jgi:hypothetical protein
MQLGLVLTQVSMKKFVRFDGIGQLVGQLAC